MALTKISGLVFYIFFVLWCLTEGAIISTVQNLTVRSMKGVCTLEVPTIDLLSAEDKRGAIPRGNGTRPGYSKIEICCSGWRLQSHTAHHCEPICDNDCENGNCTAPNQCVCHKGYIKDIKQNCIPVCPVGCLNGVCTVGGYCSCNNGYRLDTKGQMCLPYCTGGCGTGGECTGPEFCECKSGFTRINGTGKCEFFCEGGCGGGECIGPNQCSCKPGYALKNNSCQPQCFKGCLNGVCVGPNKCACEPKWTLDSTGSICQASCSKPCLNADCTAPEVCTCKQGYIKDLLVNPVGNRCVAHCPGGCENGQCSAPNFCICNPGFVKIAKGSNKCIHRVRRSVIYRELIPKEFYEQ